MGERASGGSIVVVKGKAHTNTSQYDNLPIDVFSISKKM